MPDLSWLTESFDAPLMARSQTRAESRLVLDAFDRPSEQLQDEDYVFSLNVLSLVALDAAEDDYGSAESRRKCMDAFMLQRAHVNPRSHVLSDRLAVLKCLVFGWLADQGPLAAKMIVDLNLTTGTFDQDRWDLKVWHQITTAWFLLFRKRDWNDIESLSACVAELRASQQEYEGIYLESVSQQPKAAAWELVTLYHLAKAAEIISSFLVAGSSDGKFDIRQQAESHFDRAMFAAERSASADALETSRLLGLAARQMIDNSLWSFSRGTNRRVREFITSLTSYDRPLLEVLAPQRMALGEGGLARSAKRSVVVSLPTSSGKTLIAEFQIVQNLSIFREVRGFVVYVAPTRALVNQITARLRRDLGPLRINVESVSPALEVDGVEADLLSDTDAESQFHVLVTTPEKFDLLVRGGWVEEIGRPLSLLVVDEAHNIADPARGLKIELMLAVVNRELQDSQFLLLTPFIDNANQIAGWLDPDSNQSVQLAVNWQPNDRVISLARRNKGVKRGDCYLSLQPIATSRGTLSSPEEIVFSENRPLNLTMSEAGSPNKWAAAVSSALAYRGTTITLAQTPDYAWGIANNLANQRSAVVPGEVLKSIQTVLESELGSGFPLSELLAKRIGVHHSGLPDDIRFLVEWLLENDHIDHMVATTTVAQGVNFPVANVVFAAHQYPYGQVMPPTDFWNIAGRAGRVDQGQVGVIAMVAPTPERETVLTKFIGTNVEHLDSTLSALVQGVMNEFGDINLARLAGRNEWSPFLQFLAHSYREFGDYQSFVTQVEQVLRGTFGFQMLRRDEPHLASVLMRSVHSYARGLEGKPLSLVDSTGFSWESVAQTLSRLGSANLDADVWNHAIYGDDRGPLSRMIGVMLEVPELRANLIEAAQDDAQDQSAYLANIVHDWVNGASLDVLARQYFSKGGRNLEAAVTKCCQRLFGKIAPTVSWGMSAIQSMTLRSDANDNEDVLRRIRSLPSFAYYGVATEEAVALRLLNVPRTAAVGFAQSDAFRERVSAHGGQLPAWRQAMKETDDREWRSILGRQGSAYFKVWKILDGRSPE